SRRLSGKPRQTGLASRMIERAYGAASPPPQPRSASPNTFLIPIAILKLRLWRNEGRLASTDGIAAAVASSGGSTMRKVISTLFIVVFFAGCAQYSSTEPSASPKLNGKAACDAEAGKWNDLTR